jgi:hypothetical protein
LLLSNIFYAARGGGKKRVDKKEKKGFAIRNACEVLPLRMRDSRSDDHPVKLLVKDKQFATPPREGKSSRILKIGNGNSASQSAMRQRRSPLRKTRTVARAKI